MRKKSKYKPRPVILDTMKLVQDGFRPLTDVKQGAGLRVQNRKALQLLIDGNGSGADIDTLIHASNMTMALKRNGFGNEYAAVARAGADAIEAIRNRFYKWGKVQATPSEASALKDAMELHDAQLDIVRINDLEQAIKTVKKKEAIAV